MTPERWRELRAVFDRLSSLPESERETELAALAGSDAELAREARSLLLAEARDAQFLHSPAGGGFERRGEQVGPWELLSPLGEGGMGTVFLARRADRSFDKLAAVKFVHSELLSPRLRERFAAERQALAALEHPGIARLLDGGESVNGEPYLVLEYVEGLSEANDARLARRALIAEARSDRMDEPLVGWARDALSSVRSSQEFIRARRDLAIHRSTIAELLAR